MYFPTTRVLTVLELLQSHHRLSGPELATRLEVDTRTVRRYITMLQDLGIPVEAERGRYGFYHLRPGFKLPPLMFNDDEALALTLGLLAARKIGLAVTAPAVEGALAKIERVLPLALKERVRAIQETLTFEFAPASTTPRSEIVSTLSEAAMQGRRAWLHYQSWQGEETERVIDPYGLIYLKGRWFTVGYCHLRNDMRMFRLDRVQRVALLEETFQRRPDFDCLAYVVHSLPNTPAPWFVDVLLEISLEKARRWVPPELATLEQTSNGIVLRCYVEELDWIARVLVGLRCPFVVRHPAELRDTLRRLAEEIMTMVSHNPDKSTDESGLKKD